MVSLRWNWQDLAATPSLRPSKANAWYFVPFFDEKVVLKLEANAGHIQSLGNDVPLQDRYFKGGDTFRGLMKSGVGPHMIGNDGPLSPVVKRCHRHRGSELPAGHS